MNRYIIIIALLFGCTVSITGQSKVERTSSKSHSSGISDEKNSQLRSEDAGNTQMDRALYYKNTYMNTRSAIMDADTKQIKEEDQRQLDNIIKNMEQEVPNSAECHYVHYLNGNYNPAKISELDKAYELTNNKSELLDEYIAYYELTQNSDKKKEFCNKLHKSKTISPGVMEYNFNVLMSIEKGGILFVNGTDDTYPIWIHQQAMDIRSDVIILNTDLLGVDGYRAKMLRKIGVGTNMDYNSDRVAYIKSIAKGNPDKPIYFALTFTKPVLNGLKDQLYLTGLALKYSPKKMENLPILKRNWEEEFKTSTLENSKISPTAKQINMNYIIPLVQLSGLYKEQGNEKESERLNNIILQLAKEGGKEPQVIEYMKKRE